VVLRLGGDKADDVTASAPSGNGKGGTLKVVEDIAEVRHIKALAHGFSIAVELTGLSDSDVAELIRATNGASRKANADGQPIPDSAKARPEAPEPVSV
jgi:hypothetical protein